MSRILIIGATGFCGAHFTQNLAATGVYDLHLLHRKDSNMDILFGKKIKFHLLDYNHIGELLLKYKFDAVVNFAAFYSHSIDVEQVDKMVEANVILGIKILEMLRYAGVKNFINITTNAEKNKNGEFAPNSLYAASKGAFRSIEKYYEIHRGIRIIDVFLYDSYGPNDRRNKVVQRLIEANLMDSNIDLSPGNQCLSLVHIYDVVSALKLVLDYIIRADNVESSWREVCVANEKLLTLRELVSKIEHVTGKKTKINWGARNYRDGEIMQPWIGKIVPGWAPAMSIEDGIRTILNRE